MAEADAGTPPSASGVRITPHQHTEALLSTLRVFCSQNKSYAVQVPLRLVLQYWNRIAGMSAQRALFTLTVLHTEGRLAVMDSVLEDDWFVIHSVAQVMSTSVDTSIVPTAKTVSSARRDSRYSISQTSSEERRGRRDEEGDDREAGDDEELEAEEEEEEEQAKDHGDDDSGPNAGKGSASSTPPTGSLAAPHGASSSSSLLSKAPRGLQDEGGDDTPFATTLDEAAELRLAAAAEKRHRRRQRKLNTVTPYLQQLNAELERLLQVAQNSSGIAPASPRRGEDDTVEFAFPDVKKVLHENAQTLIEVNNLDLDSIVVRLSVEQHQDAIVLSQRGCALRGDIRFTEEENAKALGGFVMVFGLQNGLTEEYLHHCVVESYRLMLRKPDDWALGPQDHYYFNNIEGHMRNAKMNVAGFDASLSWRLAILMNTNPDVVYDAFREDPIVAYTMWSAPSDKGIDSVATSPRLLGSPRSHHSGRSSRDVSEAPAAESADVSLPVEEKQDAPGDLIEFFSSRFPGLRFVEQCAAKVVAETQAVQAAQQAEEEALIAQRQLAMATQGRGRGNNGSCASMGPGSGDSSEAASPRNDFQVTLEKALKACDSFDACMELYLRQEQTASLAWTILRKCLPDMAISRDGVLRGVLTDVKEATEHLYRLVVAQTKTYRVGIGSGWVDAEKIVIDCSPVLRRVETALQFLETTSDIVPDVAPTDTHIRTVVSALIVLVSVVDHYDKQRERHPLCVRFRKLLHQGHPCFFPCPRSYAILLEPLLSEGIPIFFAMPSHATSPYGPFRRASVNAPTKDAAAPPAFTPAAPTTKRRISSSDTLLRQVPPGRTGKYFSNPATRDVAPAASSKACAHTLARRDTRGHLPTSASELQLEPLFHWLHLLDSIALVFEGRSLVLRHSEATSRVDVAQDTLEALLRPSVDTSMEPAVTFGTMEREGTTAWLTSGGSSDSNPFHEERLLASWHQHQHLAPQPPPHSRRKSSVTDPLLLQQLRDAALASAKRTLASAEEEVAHLSDLVSRLRALSLASTLPAVCWCSLFVLFGKNVHGRTTSLIDSVVQRYFHLSNAHRVKDGEEDTDHSRASAAFVYTLAPTSVMRSDTGLNMCYCDEAWPTLPPCFREAVDTVLLQQHPWPSDSPGPLGNTRHDAQIAQK